MSNEELVQLIRRGQQHYMKDLYEQNRGMIYRLAMRYDSLRLTPAIDLDDFAQTSYIALAAAVNGYDENKGAFITYLVLYLRQAMRRLIGLDGARRAHNGSISLDEPLPGTEDLTRGDVLRDDDAIDPTQAAEIQDMQRIVRAAVDRLPGKQRDVIRNRYFEGIAYTEDPAGFNAAINESKKAMTSLRRDRELRRLWDEYDTPLYRHVTLQSFQASWNSAVELAAMRREEIATRIDEIQPRPY